MVAAAAIKFSKKKLLVEKYLLIIKHVNFCFQIKIMKMIEIKFENKKFRYSNSIIISTLPVDLNSNLFGYKTKLYFRSIFLINIIINGPDRFPKDYDWLYLTWRNTFSS